MARLFTISFVFLSSLLFSQTTYNEHIKPILESNCTSCHSKGNIGPMILDNYDSAASYASMIKFVTQNNYMPPFKADYSKVSYANERSLSKTELELIEDWIDSGLLEGKKNVSTPRTEIFAEQEFDTTLCMSEAFEHYGIYYDQYQAFVLATNIQSDKKVKQVQFIPGNKEIVRSAYISVSKKDMAAEMDDWDPRYGFYSYGTLNIDADQSQWYSWMPNTPSLNLKDDEFLFLPKDSELILQIHYGPFGEIQKDSSCIALAFDNDTDSDHQIQNIPLVSTQFIKDTFSLEKNKKKRYSSSFYIPEETLLRSVTPLSHLLCTRWEIFAVLPDKTTIPLLSIDDWDFHWREKYMYKEYIRLPKNTRIISTAYYDNSLDNPYNPSDPPHTMNYGPHMYDENFLCFFELLTENNDKLSFLEKPYSINNQKSNELSFTNMKEGEITLTVHMLHDQTEKTLSKKFYPIGTHKIYSSDFPTSKGRYAISIKQENRVQDLWFFVNH